MGQPSFVKVQVFDITIEHALDGFSVVQHTVVGRLREGHHAWLDLLGIDAFEQRIGFDFGLDVGHFKFALRYGANDAVVIACGL